jgi:competence protein ComEC
MPDQHNAETRHKARAGTWPGATGVAAPWLQPLPGLAGPITARLRDWAAAEVAPGRLMPWLPVCFGFGIAIYFAAEREPVWWAAASVALFAIVCGYWLRAHPGFPIAVGCAAVAAGFATATI